MTQEIAIIWNDHAASWKEESLLQSLLNAVMGNPFHRMHEMDINQLEKWQAYDRAKAVQILMRGKKSSLGLRDADPYHIYFAVAQTPSENGILCSLNRPWMLEDMLAFTRQIARLLPHFVQASILYPGMGHLYEQQRLPKCL